MRRGKKLKASRDPHEAFFGSWLFGDLIAAWYSQSLPQHARRKVLDLGCGKVPLYGTCGDTLLPDCGEDSHRNSRGVIGFELVGRPVSERLVDSL